MSAAIKVAETVTTSDKHTIAKKFASPDRISSSMLARPIYVPVRLTYDIPCVPFCRVKG